MNFPEGFPQREIHVAPNGLRRLAGSDVVPAPVARGGRRERLDAFPGVVDARPLDRRACEHLGLPRLRRRRHQPECPLVLADGEFRGPLQVPVRLVDQDEVRDLHDPALDALQVVASPGLHQQGNQVDHLAYGKLCLANPHGLDQDDVEAGRLAQRDRFPHAAGNASVQAARRARTDVGAVGPAQPLHPGLVTENGAPGDRARGIHR